MLLFPKINMSIITYMGSLPVPFYPRMPAIDLQHDL
jgi:hypothetical protein